ncbi:hypothetical protein ACFL3V_05025 [Nanoarchaeota archaeon]
MKRIRRISKKIDDDFLDHEFDVYSEHFDDEEGLDRGMKPHEVAFLKGFQRFD